ncbi:ornithine carbamoyltransferase [Hydrogenivirga caldilitoris]|uniref:Ornithine carbamoyltransferase n=1 Tax=Hydrogenivirga caldilitoris TaxID=246264 RepID=A0A497XMD4_9AQUI|nr:ornithine carbamoyltransferase [Hydrogenivirga caldilitoris]RLJ70025.1 ornithine carbamoyltransferase [Hydrogenivirga caldilitoris]
MKRDFIDLWNLDPEEAWYIVKRVKSVKQGDEELNNVLSGRNIALLFTKPSTRTRVSFEVAINLMGGRPLFLQEGHLQLSRGEDVKDTARTLSRYVDGVVIRNNSHTWLEEFAKWSKVPVINALTDKSHPCQLLSDVFTLYERFGDGVKDIKIAYVGDGNNVCNTWLVAAGLFGLNLFVATPEGYGPDSYYLQAGLDLSNFTGGNVYLTVNPLEAVRDADVVYTDVWFSMGDSRDEEKLNTLKPYQVNEELLSHAKPEVLVMHCLPAKKGEEITEEVFEKHADFIFNQAENRLHTQKVLLEFLFEKS